MKKSDILTAIEGKKGACLWVEWTRPVALRAAYKGMPLTKSTRMLCRLAVDYDKKEETIRGRENGSLPAVNAGLKGFIWKSSHQWSGNFWAKNVWKMTLEPWADRGWPQGSTMTAAEAGCSP